MTLLKNSKTLTVTAVASMAALFTMLSTSINASHYQYHGYKGFYGYKGYGSERYFQPPAPPGYIYYQPGMQRPGQGYQKTMPEAGGGSVSTESGSDSLRVDIASMQFQPATIRVGSGDTVTWINQEAMPHTITSPNSGLLASDRLNRGGSYEHTFQEPGSYTYYCSLHPSMVGKIIVE